MRAFNEGDASKFHGASLNACLPLPAAAALPPTMGHTVSLTNETPASAAPTGSPTTSAARDVIAEGAGTEAAGGAFAIAGMHGATAHPERRDFNSAAAMVVAAASSNGAHRSPRRHPDELVREAAGHCHPISGAVSTEGPRLYPGSPLLALGLMRPQVTRSPGRSMVTME